MPVKFYNGVPLQKMFIFGLSVASKRLKNPGLMFYDSNQILKDFLKNNQVFSEIHHITEVKWVDNVLDHVHSLTVG